MDDDKKVDPFYRHRAKEIVDTLFDKRLLNDNLDRDTIGRLEDFLGFLFQSLCESAVKSAELSVKFRDSMRATNVKEQGE
jgi:hypothetical protein